MGILTSHSHAAQEVRAHPPDRMAEQRGVHFQRHAEILKPRREGMPQIMKMEVLRAEDYWSFPLDGEEWTQGSRQP